MMKHQLFRVLLSVFILAILVIPGASSKTDAAVATMSPGCTQLLTAGAAPLSTPIFNLTATFWAGDVVTANAIQLDGWVNSGLWVFFDITPVGGTLVRLDGGADFTGSTTIPAFGDYMVNVQNQLPATYQITGGSVSCTANGTPPVVPPVVPPVAPEAPIVIPGCGVALPATSVVGTFLSDTQLQYSVDTIDATVPTIPAGKTAWVLGVDESGEFYRIAWGCQGFWVPVASMGPNYDNVWHGAPLPTNVVN